MDGFDVDFAPVELHKANIGESTHHITLTERVADPIIWEVAGRPGISLADYLRLSISWGGMPGWSFDPDRVPAALTGLRTSPDFWPVDRPSISWVRPLSSAPCSAADMNVIRATSLTASTA
ncbi:hypothetical protein [Nocardia flavorosea]|uniref:Uncharacterized protein n=1 Tax=Nocardia flavorosea TaxID=53429 RepID=A0A846YH17_9NOCA|nr:hypothetical protein [Nocardia flavorosea]NKY58223.1 hypothetical protein [Nocardia flavorosea]